MVIMLWLQELDGTTRKFYSNLFNVFNGWEYVIPSLEFVLSDYEDLSGNIGATIQNSTTDNASVKYDPNPPIQIL